MRGPNSELNVSPHQHADARHLSDLPTLVPRYHAPEKLTADPERNSDNAFFFVRPPRPTGAQALRNQRLYPTSLRLYRSSYNR